MSAGVFRASYLDLHERGELSRRAARARRLMERCVLCGHRCRVRRFEGETGVCRAGDKVVVSSYGRHFGEERPLVGRRGSGTIFFTRCNLRCVFCQNWDISQEPDGGRELEPEQLARIMVYLQEAGCHNVNLVSPTHYLPQILEALVAACELGLEVPIVYNCGGYEALAALRLLDGVVDIYLPDVKYADPEAGLKYSGARDYPRVVKRALKEMHRQVGVLKTDRRGVAYRGLLVRHLVLPGGLAGTGEICRFIAEELSPETHVNIMGQYRPCYKARHYPPLDRPVTWAEVAEAVAQARAAGLTNLH
jgi:putative pyruvate formate lyase activating enzyme